MGRPATLLAKPRRLYSVAATLSRRAVRAGSGASSFSTAGKPAFLFFSELRLSELSDAVQTFKHEAAVLSRGSKFRQSLDRTFLVQMQDEELLTNDFPETCEVGKILRGHHAADFLQGSEAPVIHFPDRLEDISEGAHKSLNDATAVDGAFQLGTKTIGNGLACHIALDTPVQVGVLGIQAHQRLQQGGAVKS